MPEVEEQRILWYQNAKQIASFLAAINPFWKEDIWRKLLFDHLRMTEDEVVFMLTGEYENSIREYDKIQAEAIEMANEMTCGITSQFRI